MTAQLHEERQRWNLADGMRSCCVRMVGHCDRSKLLEHELSLCVAIGQQAKEAHAREIEWLELQMAKYCKDQRALLHRLQTNDVVEDAIRELFVKMRVVNVSLIVADL